MRDKVLAILHKYNNEQLADQQAADELFILFGFTSNFKLPEDFKEEFRQECLNGKHIQLSEISTEHDEECIQSVIDRFEEFLNEYFKRIENSAKEIDTIGVRSCESGCPFYYDYDLGQHCTYLYLMKEPSDIPDYFEGQTLENCPLKKYKAVIELLSNS